MSDCDGCQLLRSSAHSASSENRRRQPKVLTDMVHANLPDGDVPRFDRDPARTPPESLQEVIMILPISTDTDRQQPTRRRSKHWN